MDDNARTVSLSDIDSADDTYRISTREDIEPLGDVIRAVGLMHPPFLRGDHGRYSIVSGFRRIAACRFLGWTDIKVRVVGGSAASLEHVSIAIADNVLQRPLNLIETSRAIHMLSPYFPDLARLCEFSAKLGLTGSPAIFRKIERLCRMSRSLQRGILTESISLAMALELDGYEPAVSIAFAEVFQSLKLSLNRQREMVTLIKEIGFREDIPIVKLLKTDDVQAILDDMDLDRTQKVGQLRTYLRKRRFPNLTAAEKRFKDNVRAMKIGAGMQLIPPRNFEGSIYTLQMQFKDPDELKGYRTTLDKIIEHPRLKIILDR